MNAHYLVIVLTGTLLLQLCAFCFHSLGAAGDVDLSFDPGSGVNGAVSDIAVQPDGKVIIAGEFTTVRGLVRSHLARLNPDGRGDATFNTGTAVDRYVSAIAVQPDGKVIFARDFYNVVGAPPGIRAGRLNSDGTMDASFVLGLETFSYGSGFTCVALQPDGKVVLGGYFNDFFVDEENVVHYYRRSLLIRLNGDGTSDGSFTDGNGKYGGPISAMALQPDGKILIAGAIHATVDGTNRDDILRLSADGSLDSSFAPGVGGFVLALGVQSDGKVIVGGNYIGNGTNRNVLARLNADGSLDASFDPSAGGIHAMHSFAMMPETGALLVSGAFREADDQVRTRIVRLHANGRLDNSFDSGAGVGSPNNSGVSLALQADGNLFIAGAFATFDGVSRERIARLNTDGSLDTAFDPGASINGPVNEIVLEPDGKLLIRGQFTSVNGTNRNRVARLHTSGNVVAGFDSGSGISGAFFALEISAIASQTDGKVMIGGDFSSVSGTSRYRLARLDATGAVDSSFVSGIGGIGFDARPVQAIAVLADGRMLIAEPGGVDGLNSPKKIARLDPSGNVDNTFNPVIAPGSPGLYHTEANSLVVQPDGKILVAGRSLYDENHAALLLRLSADGSVDAGFERTDTAGPSSVTVISAVALQLDGKVLIGGNFDGIKGASRSGIARLNADGTLDSTFNPGSGVSGTYDPAVLSIHVQPDGGILIGGSFSSFNGTARNHFARLNSDGSLDGDFNAGTGADNVVRSIAVQPDGRVLIAGDFNSVNGVVRPRVARLYGDLVMPALSIARSGSQVILSWPMTGRQVQLQETTDLLRPDSWSPVEQPVVDNMGRNSVSVPIDVSRRFFRLRSL